MKIALWIIAICEVVRVVQNAVQLRAIKRDTVAHEITLMQSLLRA